MTPTLTLTTAMQMLPLMAATSFEHRGPQCLLTLTRSTTPSPLDQFPVRVCSCLLCMINRLYRAANQSHTHQVPGQLAQLSVFIVPPCDYPCTDIDRSIQTYVPHIDQFTSTRLKRRSWDKSFGAKRRALTAAPTMRCAYRWFSRPPSLRHFVTQGLLPSVGAAMADSRIRFTRRANLSVATV